MKILSFKKIFIYILTVICAVATLFASVFFMAKNSEPALAYSINNSGLEYRSHTFGYTTNTNKFALDFADTGDELANLYWSQLDEGYQYQETHSYEGNNYVDNKKTTSWWIVVSYSTTLDNYMSTDYDITKDSNTYWANTKLFFGSDDSSYIPRGIYGLPVKLTKNGQRAELSIPFDHLLKSDGLYDETLSEEKYYYFFTLVQLVEQDVTYAGGETVLDTSFSGRYSSNYTQFSIAQKAREYLNGTKVTLDSNNAPKLLELSGWTPSTGVNGYFNASVKFKKATGHGLYEDVTKNFTIKNWYILSQKDVVNEMYKLIDEKSISDFNAVYTSSYMENGEYIENGTRILLQAKGFDYVYNEKTQTGSVTVIYEDFLYSNLALRVQSNDGASDTAHLVLDVYTADVKSSGNYTTLTWEFSKIESQAYNSVKWIFALKPEHFEITGEPSGVTVKTSDTALTVSFTDQDELKNLSMFAVCEIVEDVPVVVTLNYIELDKTLKVFNKTQRYDGYYYSEILKLNSKTAYTKFKDVIEEGLEHGVMPDGNSYYTYEDVTIDINYEEQTCNIIVEYSNTALLKILFEDETVSHYIPLTKRSYTISELSLSVPEGSRICGFESSAGVVVENFKETTVDETTFYISIDDFNSSTILWLKPELTDVWRVTINYLEHYKTKHNNSDTPFCELKSVTKDISYSSIPNPETPTEAAIAQVLERKDDKGNYTLNVLRSGVEDIKTSYDENNFTYTFTVNYSKYSLRQINYNGRICEVMVPLISYEDWCFEQGQAWSIQFLNTANDVYFRTSVDIDRDKLYGYFTVAVFEEKITDLNAIFKNLTYEGVGSVMYNSEEAVGSEVYKFFHKNVGGDIITSTISKIGMAFCEILNDRNKVYHTYFFYLDSSSDIPFISNGGADDAFDEDSAGENFGEDVKDKIDEVITTPGEWWETSEEAKAIKIILWIVGGCLALALIIWAVRKAIGK